MKNSSGLLLFNRNTIQNFIPRANVVYYLRGIADEATLYPIYYIGSVDQNRTKQELLEKFLFENWSDVVYINYKEFSSEREARKYAKTEESRFQPKYNSLETTFSNRTLPSNLLNVSFK